jgi:hypothetical protein
MALSYVTAKRNAIPFQRGSLPPLLGLADTKWSTYSPPTPSSKQPTRRTRLRVLRAQWRKSHQSPSQIVRHVHFTDPAEEELFYTAPETISRTGSLARTSSSESRDEWYVAPETASEEVERTKSVAGLIREGKMQEEAIAEESEH